MDREEVPSCAPELVTEVADIIVMAMLKHQLSVLDENVPRTGRKHESESYKLTA